MKKGSNVNNSTLSLHIVAYENAIESETVDDKCALKNKNSDLFWKSGKRVFIGLMPATIEQAANMDENSSSSAESEHEITSNREFLQASFSNRISDDFVEFASSSSKVGKPLATSNREFVQASYGNQISNDFVGIPSPKAEKPLAKPLDHVKIPTGVKEKNKLKYDSKDVVFGYCDHEIELLG
uniref:Uncharacterized protein n=1 Tax=Panagrolaimus sp. ES5 TaxID=591445 RepID=A0AC34G721_9BILA